MGEREGEHRRAGGRESRVGGALGSLAKLKIPQLPKNIPGRRNQSSDCVCACVRSCRNISGRRCVLVSSR